MPKEAVFIRKLTENFRGDARLYEVNPPAEYHPKYDEPSEFTRFVIVSAAIVPYTGPETYIFPADENGEVLSWLELDGSYRGDLNHERALRDAGYEISARKGETS